MNFLSAEQDKLDMMLTQMGAQVKTINGLLCFVRFKIKDVELFYVYNINAKNQYYLQKVLPYPVGAGVFNSPDDIVSYIQNDINKFINASEKDSFELFLHTNSVLHSTIHKMENTFFEFDLSTEQLNSILQKLIKINDVLG